MNNFNLVLSVIKQHCTDINVPSPDCFDIVKKELDTSDQVNFDFYLDFLQDLGLIKYSGNNKHISLTERGKHTDQLFN